MPHYTGARRKLLVDDPNSLSAKFLIEPITHKTRGINCKLTNSEAKDVIP